MADFHWRIRRASAITLCDQIADRPRHALDHRRGLSPRNACWNGSTATAAKDLPWQVDTSPTGCGCRKSCCSKPR